MAEHDVRHKWRAVRCKAVGACAAAHAVCDRGQVGNGCQEGADVEASEGGQQLAVRWGTQLQRHKAEGASLASHLDDRSACQLSSITHMLPSVVVKIGQCSKKGLLLQSKLSPKDMRQTYMKTNQHKCEDMLARPGDEGG